MTLPRARKERDDNQRYDQVWCVFDVDEHQRLRPAVELATNAKIRIALSNPCFELWLVLHFSIHNSHATAADLRRKLKGRIAGYDKHLDCNLIRGRYHFARGHAQSLGLQHERANRSRNDNPSTEVWLLIDELIAAAQPGSAVDL